MPQKAASSTGRPRSRPPRRIRGKRSEPRPAVLIADDDVPLRRSLAALFRLSGFTVSCAGTIDASIRRLRGRSFDAVILDMRIPLDSRTRPDEKDGALLVLKKLAEIRGMRQHGLVDAETPIIVFTAYPSVRDAIEVTRAGAFYLPKTLPGQNVAEQLVSECSRLVARKRRPPVDPNQTWLARHYKELAAQFGGKTVAVVDRPMARRHGLTGGTAIGDRLVFAAANSSQLTDRILRNPAFRRAMPVILDVLEPLSR